MQLAAAQLLLRSLLQFCIAFARPAFPPTLSPPCRCARTWSRAAKASSTEAAVKLWALARVIRQLLLHSKRELHLEGLCTSTSCNFISAHLTPHTSHLTPHTSHLTPHTSHITHHTTITPVQTFRCCKPWFISSSSSRSRCFRSAYCRRRSGLHLQVLAPRNESSFSYQKILMMPLLPTAT